MISIVYWSEFTVAGIRKVAVKEEAGMPAEGAKQVSERLGQGSFLRAAGSGKLREVRYTCEHIATICCDVGRLV